MPANIAHMLICHKTIEKLIEKGVKEYADFAGVLDHGKRRSYLNLGSMGPDLFYYRSLTKAVKDYATEGYLQSKGVEPWSYQLHSARPNQYPLSLVEIVFKDVNRKKNACALEEEDYCRLSFIAGFLTHMAADQILHPVVNQAAGPYYRSGDNRILHRKCEVYQDYYLYASLYESKDIEDPQYNFFEQNFRSWADCITGGAMRNTTDWFRHFLQRAFAEVYGIFPDEDAIEDSVDNLLSTLRVGMIRGPYKQAGQDYEKLGQSSEQYRAFIQDIDYLRHYRVAVELAAVYLMALYEAYELLIKGADFANVPKRFKKIVRDADLSCPLETDILSKATNALNQRISIKTIVHLNKLVSKTPILDQKSILKSMTYQDAIRA